jgi:hypothetical protein
MSKLKTLILLVLSGTPAFADEGLKRCRAIADPASRLACYDALPMGPASAAPARPVPAPVAPAAPAGPSAARTAEPLYPPQSPQQFGLERKAAETELAQIESTIPGRFEGFRPNLRIRLANGQVWQVVDDTRRLYDKVDPRVTVRRGVFGAFYLNLEGENLTVRVRRVE